MSIKIFDINESWDDLFIDSTIKNKEGEIRNIYAIKNEKISDFLYKTPKLNMIFKPNYAKVKFSLHPYRTEKKSLVDNIKEIEKRIKEFSQIHYPNCKLKSIINNKKNEQKTISFYIDKKCQIYDWHKNVKSINDLENNIQVRLLLKISHFWIKDNKVGLYCSIQVLKYFPSIKDYDLIDFIDEEPADIIFPPKYPIKNVYHCLNCQSQFCYYGKTNYTINDKPNITHIPLPPPPPLPTVKKQELQKGGFVPSTTDLLKQITKLKSIGGNPKNTTTAN
jgi:hypothetical protein